MDKLIRLRVTVVYPWSCLNGGDNSDIPVTIYTQGTSVVECLRKAVSTVNHCIPLAYGNARYTDYTFVIGDDNNVQDVYGLR